MNTVASIEFRYLSKAILTGPCAKTLLIVFASSTRVLNTILTEMALSQLSIQVI